MRVSVVFLMLSTAAAAHDTWVQTNTPVVRVGEIAYIDLMLGNHGNEHRDFKLAGKVNPDWCMLEVLTPGGKRYDVKQQMIDRGYAPQEGFWTARHAVGEAGLHTVAHTLDTLHRTTRAIKSAKAYFRGGESSEVPAKDSSAFDAPLGHALELVPRVNPIDLAPGGQISVELHYQGKPLADTRVSFIPRGVELKGDFDDRYERTTDSHGRASFTPTEANYYLIVARHSEPEQRGEGYDRTAYSAALVLQVSNRCPCCEGDADVQSP
jgi:uncharacterized GH25 family protein